jgi:PII interaction protein X
MSAETYLNHPNFGMLFRICMVDDYRELFATLYAQRLFFVVNSDKRQGLVFDPIGRSDARLMLENRMRLQRRIGSSDEYGRLQALYKQTFQ